MKHRVVPNTVIIISNKNTVPLASIQLLFYTNEMYYSDANPSSGWCSYISSADCWRHYDIRRFFTFDVNSTCGKRSACHRRHFLYVSLWQHTKYTQKWL